ncbi:MAG: hypothetical protein ER33_04890 [Cyanobium sp. CACIAM 14]|nr:MAG: hypothetical protein ER33_04890 [Cyanobium sp. CACIAM 14]
MTLDSCGSAAEGEDSGAPVPNNFGPTLLLALGFLSAPVLVGVPVLILGLATLRSADGRPALPVLADFVRQLQGRFAALPWSVGLWR